MDATYREAEEVIDLAHPLRIAARQVVIDRHYVNPTTGKCIQRHRQGRHQSFTLSGPHLGDAALVENNAAHQLNVEMTHSGGTLARLADQTKDLFELGIEDALDQNAALAPIIRQLGSRSSHPFPDGLESTS